MATEVVRAKERPSIVRRRIREKPIETIMLTTIASFVFLLGFIYAGYRFITHPASRRRASRTSLPPIEY